MEEGQCGWGTAGNPLDVRKEGTKPRRYRSIDNSSAMGMRCGLGYYINLVSNLSRRPSLELDDSEGNYYTTASQADVYHNTELQGHIPIELLGEGDGE